MQKRAATVSLCGLNFTVHGLEGEIKHGGNINSYYDDPHSASDARSSEQELRRQLAP